MLNYRVIANKPDADWVVMVHGAGGSMESWFRQVPEYARHFNILLVDLIGHGESQDISLIDALGFELIAEQIIEVVDHLKIDKAHYLALSVGSIIVRQIAEKYPHRVKKMVMAGAITSLTPKAKLLINFADTFKRILPFGVLRWLLVKYVVPNTATNRFYMNDVMKVCFESFLMWMALVNKMSSFVSRLFNVRCEISTLYLTGEDDKLFLKPVRNMVRCGDENSALVVVPNAGHACNIENKQFFNKVSLNYLLLA